MFNEKDLQQITSHGLTVEQVEQQIENFKQGFPFLNVVRAAAAGDGVCVLDEEVIRHAEACYDAAAEHLGIVKFVPASGAATRMFKELFEFVNDGKRGKGIDVLLDNIQKFAFWPELERFITPDSAEEEIVEAIVKTGLGYGSKPKGLVTFHSYPDYPPIRGDAHVFLAAAVASQACTAASDCGNSVSVTKKQIPGCGGRTGSNASQEYHFRSDQRCHRKTDCKRQYCLRSNRLL